jgi:hypothetical protein
MFSLCHIPIRLILAFRDSLSILMWVTWPRDHKVCITLGWLEIIFIFFICFLRGYPYPMTRATGLVGWLGFFLSFLIDFFLNLTFQQHNLLLLFFFLDFNLQHWIQWKSIFIIFIFVFYEVIVVSWVRS